MSKDYLGDVLDKFAEVTLVLMETSKLKEDLDRKGPEDELKVILEKTKTQVDNLFEQATFLKDMFYNQYQRIAEPMELPNKKDGHNGERKSEEDTQDVESAKDKSSPLPNKPIIKLVDINKLVEPHRQAVKPQKTSPKKSVAFDNNIVIITSSEDEIQNTVSTRSPSKRKVARETIRKTKLSLSVCDDSDSKDDATIKKNIRKKFRDLVKVTLPTTSSSSDDTTDDESITLYSSKKVKTKQNERRELEHQIKEDPKFNTDCYVRVLRIPCEKLKEHYLEKLELLEIKKLCNITSKKRKRTNSQAGSSSESDKTVKQKSKTDRAAHKNKESDGDSSDSSSEDDGLEKNNSASPVPPDSLTPPINCTPDLFSQDSRELQVEQALALLPGDDDKNNDGDDDEQEAEAPVEKDSSQQKSKDKETNDSEVNSTENANDTKADEVNDKSEAEDKSDDKSDEEKKLDGNKEKDAAWKKDKLLTEKLSTTDSEEEFDKFQRKKEKQQQHSSDDEPKLRLDTIKRKMKKRKRQTILSDSDSDGKKDSELSSKSSSTSDSEEEEKDEEKKTNRKRVKRVRDSSDNDSEEGKSTRKQIRNIWGRNTLAETTKQAEAEEKERKARISEKQKKYNQIYEVDLALNARVEKVVLDFDEKNNKELIKVDDQLVEKLKPHQASGVQFMWDACFESLERAKTTVGSGCILAHCMGLGKTLQVIALAHTLLVNSEETKVKKILVVSPINTVLNWVNEFRQWLPDLEEFEIYELVSFKQNFERQYQVKTWHTHGGVLIIGYSMFRILSNPDNKRLSKKMRATFQEALVDPGPDLVICDEGHLLKNEKTNLSVAMNRLKTLRRIVLTGTPLQNNMKEYFCMVQFVKPNLLGTYKEYLNRFVNPITNGQYTDSTPHDIQIMRKRSHVLHKMLDGVVQRRDYSVLQPYLPPKYEYVLFLNLMEAQIKLYQHYIDHFAQRKVDGTNRTSFLFVDFQALQRICTHPRVLLDKSIENKLAKTLKDDSDESEGSLKDFIDDGEDDASSVHSSSSSNLNSEDEGKEGEGKKSASKKRLTRAAAALAKENGDESFSIEPEEEVEKEWWQEYCDGEELNNIAISSKLYLLFEILKECEQIGDKVLVFSQSLYSLNIIEYFLGRVHDATQAGDTDSVGGYSGSWCCGLDYFRLDGSLSCENREACCKLFNDPSNARARLFLISTRAGGLGINLVAANRVIIFDVSWNPSHDVQSIYRVYRFGQTKPCYIYRFVTWGTMEMKIYERQVTKQAISKRVIDEQQIDRHYNSSDLLELYKFDPKPDDRPIPLVPKDVLLGELLQKCENRIYKYHEHQTLLENKEAECLNEDERKAAWEEFENEKKQRHDTGNVFRRNHNVEMALVSLIRKENPTWNDKQIMQMMLALQMQMTDQMAKGDLTLYKRVQQEMQMLHALQNQQFLQQQALRLFQQQQQQHPQLAAALLNHNPGNYMDAVANPMPGTSRPWRGANKSTSSEIIDLND